MYKNRAKANIGSHERSVQYFTHLYLTQIGL